MAIISTTLKGPKRLYPQCDTDITQKNIKLVFRTEKSQMNLKKLLKY